MLLCKDGGAGYRDRESRPPLRHYGDCRSIQLAQCYRGAAGVSSK